MVYSGKVVLFCRFLTFVALSLVLMALSGGNPAQAYTLNIPVMGGCTRAMAGSGLTNWTATSTTPTQCHVVDMNLENSTGFDGTYYGGSFNYAEPSFAGIHYSYTGQDSYYPVSGTGSQMHVFICNSQSGSACSMGAAIENGLVGSEYSSYVKDTPLGNLTYTQSSVTFSANTHGFYSMCYTITFSGSATHYVPIQGGSWCSDATKLPDTPPGCQLISSNAMDVHFGDVDRSEFTGYDHSTNTYIWVKLVCPAGLNAQLSLTNIIPDSAGNGLIKTSLDGLGIGFRLWGNKLDSAGKMVLSRPVVESETDMKIALVPVNTIGRKLKTGPFRASTVMTISFP